MKESEMLFSASAWYAYHSSQGIVLCHTQCAEDRNSAAIHLIHLSHQV